MRIRTQTYPTERNENVTRLCKAWK